MANQKNKYISLLLGIAFSLIYTFFCTLLQASFKLSLMIAILFCGLFFILIPLYMRVISVAKDKHLFRVGVIVAFVIFRTVAFGIVIGLGNNLSEDDFIMLLPQLIALLSSVAFEKYYNLDEKHILQIRYGVIYGILVILPIVEIVIGAILELSGAYRGYSMFIVIPIAAVYYLIFRIKCGNSLTFTGAVVASLGAFALPVATIIYFYTDKIYSGKFVLAFDLPLYVLFMSIAVSCTLFVDLSVSLLLSADHEEKSTNPEDQISQSQSDTT